MKPVEQSTKTRRRALAPALTILITAAVVATAGVAGADEAATVYISENGGLCFTLQPGHPPCGAAPAVTIQTGDTVTWNFAGGTGIGHNVADAPAGQSQWNSAFLTAGTYAHTYGEAGTFRFLCQAHPGMEGTVTVEGEPVETQTPTPTPTPTLTLTPTPTATVIASSSTDDHTRTPAPGHGAKDTTAPRVQTLRVTGGRRALKVRFWLSEPATVAITVKRRGGKGTLRSATVQSPAGTRTLTLRDKRFRRGAFTVRLRATDAMGNRASAADRTARVSR
jgi:plastocyanin